MEDCSTAERLQQEMLCRRQWTDEYVEHPESLMKQNVVVVWIQCQIRRIRIGVEQLCQLARVWIILAVETLVDVGRFVVSGNAVQDLRQIV